MSKNIFKIKRLASLAAVLGMMLVLVNGCYMPHTGRGALVGGLTGATIGAHIGPRNFEHALVGAGVGLFMGTVIGNMVDRQQGYYPAQPNYGYYNQPKYGRYSQTSTQSSTRTGQKPVKYKWIKATDGKYYKVVDE